MVSICYKESVTEMGTSMTQLSNVLITENSTVELGDKKLFGHPEIVP